MCGTKPCIPKTCSNLGAKCGDASDGCGKTIACGSCGTDQQCKGNQCVCKPTSCTALGLTCGTADDGCGAKLSCGGACAQCLPTCPSGFSCNSETVCSGGPLTNMQLDVKVVPISGAVTLNGQKPTLNCQNTYDGTFIVNFYETTYGYSFSRSRRCSDKGKEFAWDFDIYPGTYKVTVGGYDPSGSTYKNATNLPTTKQVIHEKLVITKATANLVLDVKVVAVSGAVTLNGQKPTLNCQNTYDGTFSVTFQETKFGYNFTQSRRCSDKGKEFAWGFDIYPGTYKVTVGGYDPSGSTYKNATNLPTTKQIIHAGLVVSKPTPNLVLDVKVVAISGAVTLNGKKPTLSCQNTYDGTFTVNFYETKWGYSFSQSRRCSDKGKEFVWDFSIYPGTYRVTVGGYDPSGSTYKNATNLPTTKQVIYPEFVVAKTTSGVVLNVQVVGVSGSVTLNGGKPSLNCQNTYDGTFSVTFQETKYGYSFSQSRRCSDEGKEFAWGFDVYPGTYKVTVGGYDPSGSTYKNATNLPTTKQVIFAKLVVAKPTPNLVLNVQVLPVSGTVTINGNKPTLNCTNTYDGTFAVQFVETTFGYSFSQTRRCSDKGKEFSWGFDVYPGTYRVTVGGYDPSGSTYKNATNLPTTKQIIYATLPIKAATANVVLNVKVLPISGTITINGKTPTLNCQNTYDGTFVVRFQELQFGYVFSQSRRCSDKGKEFSWELSVYPGTYRVTVAGYDPSGSTYKNATNLPTVAQVIVAKLKIDQ